MTGRIFVLDDEGSLRAMSEEAYDSEELLQSLLTRYPDLLAGDQMNRAAPRRWLLIQRETGVLDGDGRPRGQRVLRGAGGVAGPAPVRTGGNPGRVTRRAKPGRAAGNPPVAGGPVTGRGETTQQCPEWPPGTPLNECQTGQDIPEHSGR